MLQKQIEFYKALNSEEKLIIKAFVLKSEFSLPAEITELMKFKIKLTQKIVKEYIDLAVEKGILEINNDANYQYYTKRYNISMPFMFFAMRELDDFSFEWSLVQETRHNVFFLHQSSNRYILKKFLYELLFVKSISEQTKQYINKNEEIIEFIPLSTYPEYLKNIGKLDSHLINKIYFSEIGTKITNLETQKSIIELKDKYTRNLDPKIASQLAPLDNFLDFYKGNFDAIIKRVPSQARNIETALSLHLQGDTTAAIKLMDNELKMYRKEDKSIQAFPIFSFNFFYFTMLLNLAPEAATTRAQKILNSYNKGSYSPEDIFFKAVLHNILNNKTEKEQLKSTINTYLINHTDIYSVLLIAISYLAEYQPLINAKSHLITIVRRAFEADNLLMSYEAAYVLDKWFGTPETAELYKQIAAKMSYEPACSRINRQEEWEKSLSLMMSAVGTAKSSKTDPKTAENSSRIIYIFNPNYNEFQPVLQTKNAKGEWSKGRNIAMKTLYEGKPQGMTEQDFKIAKSIKHYKGGYYDSDSYDFTAKTIVELIGHPYIFLAGANEVPVEFVAAQPIITVSKKQKGYVLESDVKDFTTGIFLQKETNTRYKVYDLNSKQINLLHLLTQQNMVVPEHGKEKLIQLLGEISKYASVHSDLLSSSNQNSLNIKLMEPDNRIRVQLLPYGDGLKAELFAKPFGSLPPYCKPGVGGKVLITNQKGEQLQVKRNLQAETKFANAILNDIQQLESVNMSDELIAFDEPLDSLHLIDVLTEHKENCVVEWPEGERFKIRSTAGFGNLKLQLKSKNNWFELDGQLKVDEDTVISIQQLMGLMATSHDRFIELKNGEFLALSVELKKRLQELYTFSTSGKNGLQINKFASVALGDFFDNVDDLKTDKTWKEFRERVENKQNIEHKIPAALQAELRPYQEDGFRWMARLAEWEGGACLADDMGLGKTVQTLAILLHRATKGAALVVCPVSVVGNWLAEAQRFAPTLNLKVLGNSNRQQTMDELEAGDVLVTSYGLLQSEEKMFTDKEFATVVLDEAHIIKNYATKTSKATMQLKAGFRLALTGTPLQNHQGEIWNLFNFINPGLLGNLNHFTDTFIKPDNDYASKLLKKIIKPFILRRTKSGVLDELPPKTEIVKKIQLSDAEMAFYEALRRQALQNLESQEDNKTSKQFQVLAEITKLRQASCNPSLVDSTIGIESSKLNTFLDIVDELIENNHRALVFSQFVSHLSIVRKALDKKGISYQYLDGSTPMPTRERSVKDFQNGEGQLFLISLKAGGLGLNLTAADYVIHLDPWWNPAIEDQASDRAHRIGQKRPVTIYRLVAENTIEEKIIKLHDTKRNLAETLLEGSDQSANLSYKELVALIQEGF